MITRLKWELKWGAVSCSPGIIFALSHYLIGWSGDTSLLLAAVTAILSGFTVLCFMNVHPGKESA